MTAPAKILAGIVVCLASICSCAEAWAVRTPSGGRCNGPPLPACVQRRRNSSPTSFSLIELAGSKGQNQPEKEKNEGGLAGKVSSLVRLAVGLTALYSVAMAVSSLIALKTQPASLQTVLPAIGNLVPIAVFGAAGTLQVLGAIARLMRILVAIPVVLGGAYLALPSVPDLLHKSPELLGGGLLALVATPEVLEAVALIAIFAGAVVWLSKSLWGVAVDLSTSSSVGQCRHDEEET
jgi:hypothetical protein